MGTKATYELIEILTGTLKTQMKQGLLKQTELKFADGVLKFFHYQGKLSDKQFTKLKALVLKIVEETEYGDKGFFRRVL